jgi:hypothetical protein
VTGMDITIHPAFLPDGGPDASRVSSRGTLASEVRQDAGDGGSSRMTAGPTGQPGAPVSGRHVRP